jgi:hypothetical protein
LVLARGYGRIHLSGIKLTREDTVLLKMEVGHLFHLDVVELYMNAHPCSTRKIVNKNKLAFLAFRYVYRK